MNTTATKILENLAGTITEGWAGQHGAKVSVAEDPGHAVDLLTAGQQSGCAVVVFYMSDTPASDIPGNTMLDATIRVGVVQKIGLEVRGGKRASPVMDKIDKLRKFLAGNAEIEGLADPLAYSGMTPVQSVEGRALNGYALSYTATYAYEVSSF